LLPFLLSLLQKMASKKLFDAWIRDVIRPDLDRVRRGIDARIDVNKRDRSDSSALDYAVRMGNLDIIKILIDSKANPNRKDKKGNTPLHAAATTGDPMIIVMLLNAKANVQQKNDDRSTPLQLAHSRKHKHIAELLMKAGAYLIAENKIGRGLDDSKRINLEAKTYTPTKTTADIYKGEKSTQEKSWPQKTADWLKSRFIFGRGKLSAGEIKATRSRFSVAKILLLGAGESGKSTLYKQALMNFGEGFDSSDRMCYKSAMCLNAITSIRRVVEYASTKEEYKAAFANDEMQECVQLVRQVELLDQRSFNAVSESIKRLWENPVIQKAFSVYYHQEARHCSLQPYFLDKVQTIALPDYVPTFEDILRTRMRSTGICETVCVIEGTVCRILLTGGQRSERRKWHHTFGGVTFVIFMASMSGYNQVLFEDGQTNRLVEDLEVFENVVNSEWFKSTPILLLLNMKDLFAEKLKRVPLTVCPAFANNMCELDDGKSQDYRSCLRCIKNKFLKQDKQYREEGKTRVKIRFTNAVDSDEIAGIYSELMMGNKQFERKTTVQVRDRWKQIMQTIETDLRSVRMLHTDILAATGIKNELLNAEIYSDEYVRQDVWELAISDF